MLPGLLLLDLASVLLRLFFRQLPRFVTHHQLDEFCHLLLKLFFVPSPADEIDRLFCDLFFLRVLPVAAEHEPVEVQREEQSEVAAGVLLDALFAILNPLDLVMTPPACERRLRHAEQNEFVCLIRRRRAAVLPIGLLVRHLVHPAAQTFLLADLVNVPRERNVVRCKPNETRHLFTRMPEQRFPGLHNALGNPTALQERFRQAFVRDASRVEPDSARPDVL